MKPIVIRIPVEARALQTISSMRSPALLESACPRSTEQTHTVSLQIMSENGILSNVLCRQAQKNAAGARAPAPFACQVRT